MRRERSTGRFRLRRLDKRGLTFAEKRSRVASSRLPAIVSHLAGSSKTFLTCTSRRSAMSSCVGNRSGENAADVALTMLPKRPQSRSWEPPFLTVLVLAQANFSSQILLDERKDSLRAHAIPGK